MTALILDGKSCAAAWRVQIKAEREALDLTPHLAVILVGDHPASAVYVRNKARAAAEIGIKATTHHLPADSAQQDVQALIKQLNADPATHGILLQLPLPAPLQADPLMAAIHPAKDVDGLHPLNLGRLMQGDQEALISCTPQGIMHLLRAAEIPLAGRDALVIGRSNIVGKPIAQLLLAADCTVTMAHSKSRHLPDLCRKADLVIAAIGRPQMIQGDWIKPGACVIDVGINRITTEDGTARLVGDVDFASARTIAGHITPVPGGIGPLTIAALLANSLKAAKTTLSP